MKPLRILNKLNTLRGISVVGSVLTPLIDNRYVPYPWIMTIIVNRRCNARCRMCNIWQDKNSPFLSLEQYEQIFVDNDFSFVKSLTLSGGEATLRSDLSNLFDLTLQHMPNIEHYALATSGLNTRRTISYVEQMMESMSNIGNKIYRFDAQISLDGVGDIHDHIRGIPGFFERTHETILGLKELQKSYPRLNIKLNSVLMHENIEHVERLQEYAKEHQLSISYTPVVLSETYYNNVNDGEIIPLVTTNGNSKAKEFFKKLSEEEDSVIRYYYRDMVGMVQGRERSRSCMMGFYGFFLEHDGNVYPCVNCERLSFGNLLTDAFEDIWFKGVSETVRKELREKCCKTCPSLCYHPAVNLTEVVDQGLRMAMKK